MGTAGAVGTFLVVYQDTAPHASPTRCMGWRTDSACPLDRFRFRSRLDPVVNEARCGGGLHGSPPHRVSESIASLVGVGAGAGPRLNFYGCGCETWKQATSYCETAFGLASADSVPGAPAYTLTAFVAKPLVVITLLWFA